MNREDVIDASFYANMAFLLNRGFSKAEIIYDKRMDDIMNGINYFLEEGKMMKQYKGWQIAKMISEGILKNGDQIKTGSGEIVTLVEGALVVGPTEIILPTSFITKDSIVFEIIEQPVTFDEVVKSDKLCRVEHELIKENPYFGKHKYRELNGVMSILSAWFGDENLKTIIREGRWYLE